MKIVFGGQAELIQECSGFNATQHLLTLIECPAADGQNRSFPMGNIAYFDWEKDGQHLEEVPDPEKLPN